MMDGQNNGSARTTYDGDDVGHERNIRVATAFFSR
jgi:hypothetical protein